MLATILERLAGGSFETSALVHSANAQISLKLRVLAADQVGIVAEVKGMLGGWGSPVAIPWSAVSRFELPA